MHGEAFEFVKSVLSKHPAAGKRVLEFGSYDVNGGVSDLLQGNIEYVGVDHRHGPGVTHVGVFHDFSPGMQFDILLCLNTLEHDPYWRESIANGMRLLKSGGLFIFTVPWGYPEHEVDCSPWKNYYLNVPTDELLKHFPNGADMVVHKLAEPAETHIWGIKP